MDLTKFEKWKKESEDLRRSYDYRWSKNIKLASGISIQDTSSDSKVRKRKKTYFRKIWATLWRIVASLYNAFLREDGEFEIQGRGAEDVRKAKLLQFLTEYRRDKMKSKQSLFQKHIWAFMNIAKLGWTCGKLTWKYDEQTGIDEPDYKLYPNEQVYPDLAADTEEIMRYIIFENYMTKDEMESLGYENIDDAEFVSPTTNPVSFARNMLDNDQIQNPGPNEYATPGKYEDEKKDAIVKRYVVHEVFYRKAGDIYLTVVGNNFQIIHKKEQLSPYGRCFPCVMGVCLTEEHKLIGEGFPEPLEGPQESINYILNMRKDNVALALTPHAVVSRYGNVDYQSMTNRRPGGITLADEPEAVKYDVPPDVTRTAYMEADADAAMMEEMSGITKGKLGMETADKATVAQINYSEANAKSDLFTAMVGETYFKSFHYKLAYFIQLFETDETAFRVANQKLSELTGQYENEYDLDFDMDCVIKVGVGSVGKDVKMKQTMLAMDRAIISNNTNLQLAQSGVVDPRQVSFFNTTKFMEDMLPDLGKKDIDSYVFNAQSVGIQQGQNPQIAGTMQPQVGGNGLPPANDLQRGGLGGV